MKLNVYHTPLLARFCFSIILAYAMPPSIISVDWKWNQTSADKISSAQFHGVDNERLPWLQFLWGFNKSQSQIYVEADSFLIQQSP